MRIGTLETPKGWCVAAFMGDQAHPLMFAGSREQCSAFAHGFATGVLVANVAATREIGLDEIRLLIEQTMLDGGLQGEIVK